MRSSPANASVICVPIDAMLMSGSATSPTKKTYWTSWPSVIDCDSTARPPTRIITMEIAPMTNCANAPTPDTPVIVVATLRNSLCAPRANTSRSLRSDRYAFTIRIPPSVSARQRGPPTTFRPIPFYDPNPPERLRQTAGHVGVDLAALAKQRPQPRKRVRHPPAEQREDQDRERGELPVQPEQHAQRDGRRDQAADELDQPRPNEIPNAFGVGHDARNQDAGLRRVEVGDGQAQHERLNRLAHLGDRALRRDAEDLRERKRADRLHDRRDADRQRDQSQQVGPMLADDLVDQIPRRPGEHEPGNAIDQHERQPEPEAAAVLPHELPRFDPRVAVIGFRFLVSHEGSLQETKTQLR